MNTLKTAAFVVTSLMVACESGIVDTIGKCPIEDKVCQKQLFENTLHTVAENGALEYGVPVLDPFVINDMTVNVLGMVNITMVKGTVEGLKNVKVENYDVDFEKGTLAVDVSFDNFPIQGQYNVKSAPIIETLLGNAISGDGNGKILMEKLFIKFNFEFRTVKGEDGEIYMIPDLDKIKYKFDADKVSFEADDVKFGTQNIAPLVMGFMNANSKYMTTTFGRFFADKGIESHGKYAEDFFKQLPAKSYLTGDLAAFVKS